MALLLLAIALACYSLLTGGGSDNESEAGPEVVWPDPSAQTESQTAWQNRQANAAGSTGDDTSDRTRAATDAYMQNTNAPNEAITPPPILDSSGSSNSSDEQAVDDGDLGSGDQAEPYYPGAEASYPALNGAQTPSPEGEPANAAYGPVDSGVPYGDGAYGPAETYGGYSDDSGAAYGDGSQYADTGYPSNQDSPATTSPTISPVSGPTGVAPQPSVPAGQPYVYPDTGYPEFDLRYASRPGERSAQLPASPNGTTEVIQPPTTGQQYERTGSGLY